MHYTVSAIVSPAFIVIGQNPARFKRSKLKQQQTHSPLSSLPSSPAPPSSAPNSKKRRSESPPSQYLQPSNPYYSNVYNNHNNSPFTFDLPQNGSPIAFLPSPQSPAFPPDNSLTPSQLTLPNQDSYFGPSPPTLPNQDAYSTSANLLTTLPLLTLSPPTVFPSSPLPLPASSPPTPSNEDYPLPPASSKTSEYIDHTGMSTVTTKKKKRERREKDSDLNSGEGHHVLSGKVGINYQNPHEALTVGGSIFYTGDLFKPSDRYYFAPPSIFNQKKRL